MKDQKRKIRLFEIFDKMSVNDTNKGTKTLPVGMDLVSAEYKKGRGTVVSIGVEGNSIEDIHFGKVRPLLVMLDMDLYRSMENEELLESPGLEAVSAERFKQIMKHGYTAKNQAEHPEFYDEGQPVHAARELSYQNAPVALKVPKNWDEMWFRKLALKPYAVRLEISGALLVAELDRLDYIKNNFKQ